MTREEELEIILKVRSGDTEAFEALVLEHQNKVYSPGSEDGRQRGGRAGHGSGGLYPRFQLAWAASGRRASSPSGSTG